MTGSELGRHWLRAVLDANVLLQAPIRDTLLRAAEEELFLPRWSQAIIAEAARNLPQLTARRTNAAQRAAHLVERLTAAFPEALVEEDDTPFPPLGTHPGDRHVLATAIRFTRCAARLAARRDCHGGGGRAGNPVFPAAHWEKQPA